MNFEFATAQRIIFGNGCVNQLPGILNPLGKRLLVLTGTHNHLDNPIHNDRELYNTFSIKPVICDKEPSIIKIRELLNNVRSFSSDAIISIGGGSVIDTGKALSALLANEGDILDYIEVIGKGHPLENSPIPFIAIPTTAGTGSEVTRNAVLYDEDSGVKASLRSSLMLPKVAMIDPLLTLGLPAEVTAYTGMDALTQVIEPLLSKKANPITDAICRQAIQYGYEALLIAYQHPENIEAREKMALVSVIGGLALANSGLGVVHGFAAAIGGMYPNLRHGQICAALLPASIRINRKVCSKDPELSSINQRFLELDELAGENIKIPVEDKLEMLNRKLNIQSITGLGIKKDDYPAIIEKTKNSSSYKGNPTPLTNEELMKILEFSE